MQAAERRAPHVGGYRPTRWTRYPLTSSSSTWLDRHRAGRIKQITKAELHVFTGRRPRPASPTTSLERAPSNCGSLHTKPMVADGGGGQGLDRRHGRLAGSSATTPTGRMTHMSARSLLHENIIDLIPPSCGHGLPRASRTTSARRVWSGGQHGMLMQSPARAAPPTRRSAPPSTTSTSRSARSLS